MGMVARYHHVQILKVKYIGGSMFGGKVDNLYSIYLSEPVLSGSLKQDYMWVHAIDELHAWKLARDYLDGKRG